MATGKNNRRQAEQTSIEGKIAYSIVLVPIPEQTKRTAVFNY